LIVGDNGKIPNLLLDDPIRQQEQQLRRGEAADSGLYGRDLYPDDQDGVNGGEPQMDKDDGSGKRRQ
jgi:hypothetical protein